MVACKPGLGGAMLPRKCETVDPVTNQACPLNSWVVLGERSKYVDQQTLKLQVRRQEGHVCCKLQAVCACRGQPLFGLFVLWSCSPPATARPYQQTLWSFLGPHLPVGCLSHMPFATLMHTPV